MKFAPYSISKLGCYGQCPLHFKLKYIDKIKVPFTMNIALYKGNYIHSLIENNYDYSTEFKTNKIFTEEEKEKAKIIVKNFEESKLGIFYKIKSLDKSMNSINEEKFGFKIKDQGVNQKINLELCSYDDKQCWIRGAIDFQYIENNIAYNIDWKSGKDRSEERDYGASQSMAYSIYLLLKYPKIKKVISKFVFVEHLKEKEIVYTRDKLRYYIKYFCKKTNRVENDLIYKEKVSALCNYCDFNNHGHCTKYQENEEKSINFMMSQITF